MTLAQIVTQSSNTAQTFALVALIVFAVSAVWAITHRGFEAALLAAGLAFLAAALLFLA